MKKIDKQKRVEFYKFKKSIEKIKIRSEFCKTCFFCVNECKQFKTRKIFYCPLFEKNDIEIKGE